MKNPLVSIIIPLYNAENYIGEAINSILNQSYKNWEIIIINDGSEDNSYKVAKTFESDRIRVYTQKNRGAAAARNLGIEFSKGHFIQFLDADDLLHPKKIEKQITLLEDEDERMISSCEWGRFRVDISNTTFKREKVWKDYNKSIDWLIDSWEGNGMMLPACWIFSKKLLEKSGGWNESLSLNDDGEFFSRLLLETKGIKHCEESIVYYRSDVDQSLSRKRSEKAIQSAFEVCVLYENHLLRREDSPRVRHALMRNYLTFIYEYQKYSPALVDKAKDKIHNLGFMKLEPVGSKSFKRFSKIVGVENALNVKSILKR